MAGAYKYRPQYTQNTIGPSTGGYDSYTNMKASLEAIEKFMSTGENINANGSVLTANMVRGGFQKFPQSDVVLVGPELWPQIAPLRIAADYPFKADMDDTVPPGELWYIGGPDPAGPEATELLGRIINIGMPTSPTAGT